MSKIIGEIWLPIKGYEKLYEVSSLGRARSIDHETLHRGYKMNKTGKILSTRRDGKGYHQYRLYKNGKSWYPKAHRLVAEHFLPNPEELPQINHKDKNKENNCVSNLEWCTNLYNMRHSFAKDYVFMSPEGDKVNIHNLRKFCIENNLQNSLMAKVLSKERSHHKGWRIWEE